jgi:hypothetical protein
MAGRRLASSISATISATMTEVDVAPIAGAFRSHVRLQIGADYTVGGGPTLLGLLANTDPAARKVRARGEG